MDMIAPSLQDRRLIAAINQGLPLQARPYQALGEKVGMSENEVIRRLSQLIDHGVIRRFGVIVRHHRLGYKANAMSVWDIPDAQVDAIGERMGRFSFVTLCYQRPRRRPHWPYNLFAMIHGVSRKTVRDQISHLARCLDLENVAQDVLFSRRQFKQCGARYGVQSERRP